MHQENSNNVLLSHELGDTELSMKRVRCWRPDRKLKIVLAVQAFCVFIISLDMTILTTTLPTVAHALDATAVESYWIAASYLLANAVCQPIMAAFADAFGRQFMFLGSLILFTVGSIVCATAPTVPAMLTGRTIQGVGGGGILSVNLIILTDLVPLQQRPKYQAYIQSVFGLGTTFAPIMGGALIRANWRWVFYINLPFCGVGLFAVPLLLRYEMEKKKTADTLSSVDWIGSALMVVSSTVFLVGMSWGGNEYKWRSAAVLAMMSGGLAGLIATVLYERYSARNPFLRLTIFGTWSGILVSICTLLQGYILFAMTYYLHVYLMACKLYTPIIAGTAFLAFAVTVLPVSGITGPLITYLGRYTRVIQLGWLLSVLGSGLLIMIDVNTHPAAWVVIFMCAGAGQGLLLIGHSVAIQASCREDDAAHAISMYSFLRSLGLCMGVILGGTIFQNFLRLRLQRDGLPVGVAANFEGFLPTLQSMPEEVPMKMELQQAYAWALKSLFGTSTGIGFVGLLLSLKIDDYTLIYGSSPLRKTEE